MMTTAILLSIAAILAVVFGKCDAQTIDAGDRIDHKKLAWQVVYMFAALLAIAYALTAWLGTITWWHLLWIPMCYGAFTPIDRIILNLSRKKPKVPISWMGPHIRGPKESLYDSAFWNITRDMDRSYITGKGMHYVYSQTSRVSPFAAAMILELSVLAASITLFLIN